MTTPELIWQKSSFSGAGGNNCVEIATVDDGDGIAIRESTEPERVVRTTRCALGVLIEKVKAGGFDGG